MLAAFAIARRSHAPCSLRVAGESGSGYSRCVFLFGRFAPSRCAESRKIDCRRNNSLSHGFCVVSSLPLLDHRDGVFVCLGLPPAELVRRRFPSRATHSRPNCGGARGSSRAVAPRGLAGSPRPLLASAARYARTARRRGRLWLIGVSLRLAFLSAGAQQLQWRLSLSLRGCCGCLPAAGVGGSVSCSLVTAAVRLQGGRTAAVTSSQVAP